MLSSTCSSTDPLSNIGRWSPRGERTCTRTQVRGPEGAHTHHGLVWRLRGVACGPHRLGGRVGLPVVSAHARARTADADGRCMEGRARTTRRRRLH